MQALFSRQSASR